MAYLESQFDSDEVNTYTSQLPLGSTKVVVDIGGLLCIYYSFNVFESDFTLLGHKPRLIYRIETRKILHNTFPWLNKTK